MEDIKYVYERVFKRLKQYSSAIPLLVLVLILYSVVLGIVDVIFARAALGNMYFFIGILKWGIGLVTMAHFAGLILTLNARGKLRFEDIKNFELELIAPLSQVYFILYLIQYTAVRIGILSNPAGFIIISAYQIFLIPMYEIVYIDRKTGLEAFSSLFEYWKVNWKPLVVFVLICGLISIGLSFLPIIGGLGVILGVNTMVNVVALTPFLLIATVITSIAKAVFLLSKSILFQETYFSNPRSRQFRRN